MTEEQLEKGRAVLYVPLHAHGDRNHVDCELGVITSWSVDKKTVLVRYGRDMNSKATTREDLEVMT